MKPVSVADQAKQTSVEEIDTHLASCNKSLFKCNHCDVTFKSEKGLNIHIGKSHKLIIQITPEKERSASLLEEPLLTLTPNKVDREEDKLEDSTEKVKETELKNIEVIEKSCPICPDDGWHVRRM